MNPALQGFLLGGGLIVAIGAQNAFVLRQGLARRFVAMVCLVCALSDAALIAVGVAGVGTLVAASAGLLRAATIGGAVFLAGYGLLAVRRAFAGAALDTGPAERPASRIAALSACLAFTFLNPHVYLDTVVLVGSVSGTHAGPARLAFAGGAVAASFVWFFALGYGARALAPLFVRPAAWRVLDLAIAAVMFALAWGLARAAADQVIGRLAV